MESITDIAPRAYQKIAEHAYPNGSVVKCLKCRAQRNATTSEIAGWMQNGFPKCKRCGKTVDLINPHTGRDTL